MYYPHLRFVHDNIFLIINSFTNNWNRLSLKVTINKYFSSSFRHIWAIRMRNRIKTMTKTFLSVFEFLFVFFVDWKLRGLNFYFIKLCLGTNFRNGRQTDSFSTAFIDRKKNTDIMFCLGPIDFIHFCQLILRDIK